MLKNAVLVLFVIYLQSCTAKSTGKQSKNFKFQHYQQYIEYLYTLLKQKIIFSNSRQVLAGIIYGTYLFSCETSTFLI